MAVHNHQGVVSTRGDVTAELLAGRRGIDDAVSLIDRAEAAAGVPLVDEAERHRLQLLATGESDRSAHWHSLLARRDDCAVGYAGVVIDDGHAQADVALDRSEHPTPPVLQALLEALRHLVRHHDIERLRVWLRHADASDVACAANDGFSIHRRLGVLGRHLDERPAVPDHGGLTIRVSRESDVAQIVEVLAAAYEGTPDGGWTAADFERRRGMDWFRHEDLLVAEDADGRVVGVHWTKRRGEGVGEVYNLAVRPEAHGGGVGAVLLAAGLRHLAEVGCQEVLLWVDLANERALRLYVSYGFTTRWEDLELGRTVSRRPASEGR